MNASVTDHGKPKPDHVPDALVYEFDYNTDAELMNDPFARADRLLNEAPPIFWTPYNGGHWYVTSFEGVSAISRDYENFSTKIVPQATIDMLLAELPPGTATPMNAIPSSIDPPEHASYRVPLNNLFAPKVAMGMKEKVRGFAIELIEKVQPNGRCELMSEITEPLPVQMFLKLFGLPVEKWREYRDVFKKVATGNVHDPRQILANTQTLIATYTQPLIDRRDNPQDDIVSAMWQLEINGRPMSLEIMQSYCLSLFLAGLDTVMNAMTFGTRHLALYPELQEQARADPKMIVQMTEELIRLYSFPNPIRVVARDTEIQGVQMKVGDRIHMSLATADRDPTRFDEPGEFLMDRKAKRHLGFGDGAHLCVGMHLARVELHVYYEELLARFPTFRLDPDQPATFHGGVIIGPRHLHLLWN